MTDAKTRRVRRTRGLTESLLSIVLTLEAVVVFFIALTLYGLHVLGPALAFGGGVVVILVLLAATRIVQYGWGVWVGWILQLGLLATGLLLVALYVVALFFIAMWTYCVVRASQIERRNAAAPSLESSSPSPKETP